MRGVILLVFIYHVVSQPVSEELSRHPRELIECCPCPGSSTVARSRAVDDCPCRPPSTDSEGAPSMVPPSILRSDIPFLRSNEPKVDQKNLLEPEVGLATSMLQTLREATEEEYRDALARDAAKVDAVSEESARNVVIIVKPSSRATDNEDSIMAEESNVNEERCIHPLGAPLGKMRTASKPLKLLPDIFKLPKAPSLIHRNIWDTDGNVGASNIQESIVNMDEDMSKLKANTPQFTFRPPLKAHTLKAFEKVEQSLNSRPNLFEGINLPAIPQVKLDNPLKKYLTDFIYKNDLSPAPSNNQEAPQIDDGKIKFNKSPPLFKNLLKLKDVELIPKSILNRSVIKSKDNSKPFSLPTPINSDDKEDLSYNSAMNENVFIHKNDYKASESDTPRNVENRNYISNTYEKSGPDCSTETADSRDIQDALTSPSEVITNILDNNVVTNEVRSAEINCDELSSEEPQSSTTERDSSQEINETNKETLNPTIESDIINTSDNERESNISQEYENNDGLTCDNDDSDMNNHINIDTTPQTNDDVENTNILSKLLDFDEIAAEPLSSRDDEVASHPSAEGEKQIISPNFSGIDKLTSGELKPITHLSETLSTFENSMAKRLEDLKINTINLNSDKIIENTKQKDLQQKFDEQPKEVKNIEPTEINDSSKESEEVQENPSQVTFKDLEKLSNDLLILSSNKEQIITSEAPEIEEIPGEPELPEKQNSDESDLNKNDTLNDDSIEPDDLEVAPATNSDIVTIKEIFTKSGKEKGCQTDFESEPTQKPDQLFEHVRQPEDDKEMVAEGSAPVASTLPTFLGPLNSNTKLKSPLFQHIDPLNSAENFGSPVFQGINLDPLNLNEILRSKLQDIVLQPNIPQPINLLGKPINEVFKLPTLEDLRQQLTSVIDNNERSNESGFSEENIQCSNVEPVEMSSAASTTNLRKPPIVRPLEDFNVDIFQLQPLSSSQPDIFSKVPKLNLNNFRAKLPIPNNLDLKPLKLESRVGNDKGILGASLSFGSDRMQKKNPNNLNFFGSRLGKLPTFDELRNNFHSNTQGLLGKSLQPNYNLFIDNPLSLPTGLPDIDEVRRNAEKTMKGLQQRMKSTLNGRTFGSPLSEKFARPQDLLEDVNDKLKAIHYDLNDRLSSIHESIIGQSRLKPLTSPALTPTFPTKNTNRNVMNNIRKTKAKPARLQTSASTLSQEDDPVIYTNNNRNSFSSSKNGLKKGQAKPNRTLFGAESSPVPTQVEYPQPKLSNEILRKNKPPLSQRPSTLRQDAENEFPQSLRGKAFPAATRHTGLIKDLKTPTLRKPNPFKDKMNKVTISFATTTISPISSSSEKYRNSNPINLDGSDIPTKLVGESLREGFTVHRDKLLDDAKQSPEIISSRMLAPVKSKNNFKTANSDIIDTPQLQSLEPSDTKSRLPSFKGKKEFKIRGNENGAFDTIGLGDNVKVMAPKLKPFVWPKSGEDSFITKVREAMKVRLASFDPANTENSKVVKIPAKQENLDNVNTDQARSASENHGMILIEPLKENISFKCKMVCTRE